MDIIKPKIYFKISYTKENVMTMDGSFHLHLIVNYLSTDLTIYLEKEVCS